MMATYEAIATVELTSGSAASLEFTGIASDWTDLLVKASFRGNGDVLLYLNNATFGSSGGLRLNADGLNPGTNPANNGFVSDAQYTSFTANTFGSIDIYIANYNSTTDKRTSSDAVTENAGTTAYLNLVTAKFTSTTAITSVKLTAGGGNVFSQYSTATLYGILNS